MKSQVSFLITKGFDPGLLFRQLVISVPGVGIIFGKVMQVTPPVIPAMWEAWLERGGKPTRRPSTQNILTTLGDPIKVKALGLWTT